MRGASACDATPHINLPHKGAELEISCGRAARLVGQVSVWAQKLVPAAATHKGVNGLAKQQCGTKTSVSRLCCGEGGPGGAAALCGLASETLTRIFDFRESQLCFFKSRHIFGFGSFRVLI